MEYKAKRFQAWPRDPKKFLPKHHAWRGDCRRDVRSRNHFRRRMVRQKSSSAPHCGAVESSSDDSRPRHASEVRHSPPSSRQRLFSWLRGDGIIDRDPPPPRPPAATISERTEFEEYSSPEPSLQPPRLARQQSSGTGLGRWYEHRLRVLLDLGWLREEVHLAWLLLLTILLGSTMTYASWLIPYVWAEIVGMCATASSIYIFTMMVQRRVRVLEMMPVTVAPGLVAIFFNYIRLAEAVDKDSYALSTEDALEVNVETHLSDRRGAAEARVRVRASGRGRERESQRRGRATLSSSSSAQCYFILLLLRPPPRMLLHALRSGRCCAQGLRPAG